jgi:hypothetical protein
VYIFFLLINLTFSWIFYIFLRYVESIFFLVTWIIMFFYFSPLYFWKKTEKKSILSKVKISKDTLKKTIPLFQKISYLIAFFFFYLSLYWISLSFNWNIFQYFTLIISLLLIVWFFIFIKKQKPVLWLIYRSNFLIYSFLYIILFTNNMIFKKPIDDIFVINSSLSLFWLVTTILFDKNLESLKKNAYYTYFLTYLNFYLLFYIRYKFDFDFVLIFNYLFFIMSIFYFEFIGKIKYFDIYDINSKYYWIFLNYIICIISFVYLFISFNYWHFVLLIFWSLIFHYYVHFRFKNYLSLVIVILGIVLIYIKNFIPYLLNIDFVPYMLFIYMIPAIFIWYTYITNAKYEYDNYFIHFSWILFSLVSIIIYFILSKDFQILHISIIFLLQSFVLFWSFAKLKPK